MARAKPRGEVRAGRGQGAGAGGEAGRADRRGSAVRSHEEGVHRRAGMVWCAFSRKAIWLLFVQQVLEDRRGPGGQVGDGDGLGGGRQGWSIPSGMWRRGLQVWQTDWTQ